MKKLLVAAVLAVVLIGGAPGAHAFKLAIIAFQMSSETHARVANAAAAAAKAKGWDVQILNSEGSLPKHAEQIEAMIQAKPDGLIIAMGKPVEADAQLAAAKQVGIPVITTVAGTSPHTLFDIQVNDYQIGAQAALYLIDDILRAQGMKKGDVALVSIDGGPESNRRIKDPDSLLTATVAIPFEKMGGAAVDAMDQIVVKKVPKEKVVQGPYLWMDAVL